MHYESHLGSVLIKLRSPHDRAIFTLALPALGSLAADPLVSLVDTAFVGRLGPEALAALGVNAALFNAAFFVFNFLAYGTTPLVGSAHGRGDARAAGRWAWQALLLAAALGLCTTLALLTFSGPLLGVMGADAALKPLAAEYLLARAWAGPAVLLITAVNGIFRGLQNTRLPFYVTLGVSLVNLCLDPLFIFGFGLGVRGAALATVIAQWLGALTFLILLFRTEDLRLSPTWPGFKTFAPFLKIGWELLLRSASLIAIFTLATAVAARLGILEVAVHQVIFQLWLFLALVVDALAIAAQALIARYLGENDVVKAKGAADRLLFLGLLFGAFLAGLFWLLKDRLPQLFSNDPAVLAGTQGLYMFVVLVQIVNAVVFVFDGVYIGAGRFRFLALAMLGTALPVALLLLLVEPLGWGLTGIWWLLTVFMLLRLALLGTVYWQRDVLTAEP